METRAGRWDQPSAPMEGAEAGRQHDWERESIDLDSGCTWITQVVPGAR